MVGAFIFTHRKHLLLTNLLDIVALVKLVSVKKGNLLGYAANLTNINA